MRTKINVQGEFDFEPSHLKVTNTYYAKYEEISTLLDAHPRIVDLVHHDLKDSLQALNDQVPNNSGRAKKGGSTFKYTSDTVLRILLCQVIENLSLRGVVVRVDDSHSLRRFVRIYSGPMLDYTTLCNLKNAISANSWKQINEALARGVIKKNLISGEALRLDTTAVETHVHWPTDSSLLWDTYRVLARLIEQARRIDPSSTDSKRLGSKRLLTRKAKKIHAKIARKAVKNARLSETVKTLYSSLIGLVYRLCEWSADVAGHLERGISQGRYDVMDGALAQAIIDQVNHHRELGARVMDQAQRRVFNDEKVPNDEKLFSIFEPHTELLKRGKAGKPIEFGHMVEIEQVVQKFITNYAVYERKPIEHELVGPALDHHKKLFGHDPDWLAADKGYYLTEQMDDLRERVEVVSIAKKGTRTAEETEREEDPLFRHAQRFRAGIEGTISFLKRILGMFRCHNKTWEHYEATIGLTVLAHNLLTLSRG